MRKQGLAEEIYSSSLLAEYNSQIEKIEIRFEESQDSQKRYKKNIYIQGPPAAFAAEIPLMAKVYDLIASTELLKTGRSIAYANKIHPLWTILKLL